MLFWLIFGWLSYRYTIDFLKLIKLQKTNEMMALYSIANVLVLMVPVYLNYFFLLPNYFLKRRFILYFLLMFLSVLAGSFFICMVED